MYKKYTISRLRRSDILFVVKYVFFCGKNNRIRNGNYVDTEFNVYTLLYGSELYANNLDELIYIYFFFILVNSLLVLSGEYFITYINLGIIQVA